MQIVLMLDSQAPSQAIKPMEGLQCIPVVVNDIARARYVLLNMSIDLWICDLNLDDLDFRRLHSESMTRNCRGTDTPDGNTHLEQLANTLIKKPGDSSLPSPGMCLPSSARSTPCCKRHVRPMIRPRRLRRHHLRAASSRPAACNCGSSHP